MHNIICWNLAHESERSAIETEAATGIAIKYCVLLRIRNVPRKEDAQTTARSMVYPRLLDETE